MAKKQGGGGATGKSGGTNAPQKSPSVASAHHVPKAVAGAKAVAGPGKKQGGKKQGEHAGEVYNPGQENPVVPPFMNAEDIMSYSQARSQYQQQLNELDFNYEQSQINTQREKEGITKREGYDLAGARNDMAARGLQRSSVRDADLFDINATAEMKKQALDTNLNTLKLHTDAEKSRLQSAWEDPETGYMHGLQMKMAQNAMSASSEAGQWAVEPHWEKKPGAPSGNKPPKKPTQGGGFKTGAPVPNPNLPKPPPTKTGGTQYPGKPGGHTTAVSQHKILGKTNG